MTDLGQVKFFKRCPRCTWPLKDKLEDGCIEGNCSYRCNCSAAHREDCALYGLSTARSFVVRCRYAANGGKPGGVGYLDRMARCTTELRDAQPFNNEDDAWTFAATSGEEVPNDVWVEEMKDG